MPHISNTSSGPHPSPSLRLFLGGDKERHTPPCLSRHRYIPRDVPRRRWLSPLAFHSQFARLINRTKSTETQLDAKHTLDGEIGREHQKKVTSRKRTSLCCEVCEIPPLAFPVLGVKGIGDGSCKREKCINEWLRKFCGWMMCYVEYRLHGIIYMK